MSDKKSNTGDYNIGDYNTRDYNTGDYNTGHCNTGDCNTRDCNTGDYNAGDYNTGPYNTGDCNTGPYNTGHCNTGPYNTGDCNTGPYNTGMFNTDEPKIRIFNKDSEYTRTEMSEKGLLPHYSEFYLTKWVSASDMDKDEKKEHPFYKITNGYLKEFSYKEAWANFWRDTDEENKQKFLNLPNFDANIFKEITGIDVNSEDFVEIDGVKWSKETLKEIIKNTVNK